MAVVSSQAWYISDRPGPSQTKVTLIFANKNAEAVMLTDQLDQLSAVSSNNPEPSNLRPPSPPPARACCAW